MKNIFIVAAMVMMFTSCKKDDEVRADLTGVYQQTEILADPGDGSGIFQPANTDKMIKIYGDGTVRSNGNLCFRFS